VSFSKDAPTVNTTSGATATTSAPSPTRAVAVLLLLLVVTKNAHDLYLTEQAGSSRCPVVSQSNLRQTRKRFVPRFLGKNMRDSAPIRPLRQQSLRRMCTDNQGFVGTSLDQNQWLDPSGTTPSPEPHCQHQNLRRNEVGVTSAQPCKMIQLSANAPPLRLRGAAETEACILQDFYMPALCVCCETELFCIQDADYVLCPKCYGISPFDGNAPNRDQHILGGGIGLGFTFEDLSIIISRDL